MHPDLFPTDDAMAQIEAGLHQAAARTDGRTLLNLAWALRQRDGARALQLAAQATELGDDNPRLDLIRAEVFLLRGDVVGADRGARRALEAFASRDDAVGQGDAQWLLASIAYDENRNDQIDAILAAGEASYDRAEDPVRRQLIRLRRFTTDGKAFATDARDQWQAMKSGLPTQIAPPVVAWCHFLDAFVQGMGGHLAESVAAGIRAHEALLGTGQVELAVVCATNVANAFEQLNDLEAALDWANRSLEHARTLQSRAMQSLSLCMLGYTLLRLNRIDAATSMLEQSLQFAVPGTSHHGNSLATLGYLALALKDGDAAYRRASEAMVVFANMPTALAMARAEKAKAALLLGRTNEAHALCDDLLLQSRDAGDAPRTVELLLLRAKIHQRQRQDRSLRPADDRAALDALTEALQLAAATPSMTISYELLDVLAEESAVLGDMRGAYEFATQAREARETIRSRQASDRAVALQVQHETERHKLEAAHQRALGQQERQRAEQLAQANATLERLGVIGREITANLESTEVFAAIERHLNDLLDAFATVIFRVDPERECLDMVFGVEGGCPLPMQSVPMAHSLSHAARCARERVEIIVDAESDDELSAALTTAPDTLPTRSMMFAPLLVGARLLGVLTIQSLRPDAYGERERSIFRTLCTYVAIALANADTLLERRRQERGIMLDVLAHEVRQPLNNASAALQGAAGVLRRLGDKTSSQPLQAAQGVLDEVVQRVDNTLAAAVLIAGRRLTETPETDLDLLLATVLADFSEVEREAFRVVRRHSTRTLAADPGLMRLALRNLLTNALRHGRAPVILTVDDSEDPLGITLEVRDHGAGVPDHLLAQPLGTREPEAVDHSARRQGLGLYIVRLVMDAHGGGFDLVHNGPHGATFRLVVPADPGGT